MLKILKFFKNLIFSENYFLEAEKVNKLNEMILDLQKGRIEAEDHSERVKNAPKGENKAKLIETFSEPFPENLKDEAYQGCVGVDYKAEYLSLRGRHQELRSQMSILDKNSARKDQLILSWKKVLAGLEEKVEVFEAESEASKQQISRSIAILGSVSNFKNFQKIGRKWPILPILEPIRIYSTPIPPLIGFECVLIE